MSEFDKDTIRVLDGKVAGLKGVPLDGEPAPRPPYRARHASAAPVLVIDTTVTRRAELRQALGTSLAPIVELDPTELGAWLATAGAPPTCVVVADAPQVPAVEVLGALAGSADLLPAPVVVVCDEAPRGARRTLLRAGAMVVIGREASGELVDAVAEAHERFELARDRASRERLLAELVEHSDDFISLTDVDGRLMYLNRGARDLVGVTSLVPGELHVNALMPAGWQARRVDEILPAVQTKGRWLGEMPLRHVTTGALVEVSCSSFLLHDPVSGEIRGIGTIARAIHEERRMADSLRESLAFTRRVLDNLFGFVGVLEPDGTLVDANRAPMEAAGITIDDIRGQKFWDCHWWSYDDGVRTQVRDACFRAAAGETVRYDVAVRMAGDARIWIDFQIAPLRGADGRVQHLIPSGMDIMERKRVEEALRRSERRLTRLFETNLLGVVFWDLDGRVHDANDEFLRLVGYEQADLRAGRVNWSTMTPPEYKAQDMRAVEDLQRAGVHTPLEKEYVRKDGTRLWVLFGGALIEGSSGVSFVLDITQRKRAERALVDSEARARAAAAATETERALLNAVFEAAPVGIIIAEQDGRISRMNPANERLWGPAPNSRSVEEYAEWKGWWADGSERHGRRIEPEEWALTRALHGETVREDLIEVQPFGRDERRTMMNTGAPVRDPSGTIVGAVVAQMDITGLVHAETRLREVRRAQEALASSLAEKEILLKEIHHRVKNNLQVIASLLKLHAEHVVDPVAAAAFEDSRARVRAIALLHEKLYQSKDLGQIDLAEYTQSLLDHVLRSQRPDARDITMTIDGEGIRLPLDKAVPCGLILNEVITNALKHAFHGSLHGPPSLTITITESDGQLRLTVRDNGVGLPADLDAQPRRSLGMHLIRTLARQLGGQVTFITSRGTQCTIEFPREEQ